MAQQQVYRIANYKACKKGETLVDRGANGGLAGSDIQVINKTGRSVDVIDIDNHTVNCNIRSIAHDECHTIFDDVSGDVSDEVVTHVVNDILNDVSDN
jgi:hypothetical protein